MSELGILNINSDVSADLFVGILWNCNNQLLIRDYNKKRICLYSRAYFCL